MSDRKTWISAANIFACFGVIVLHCNGIFWSFPSGRLWYTSNFLETFFYWPVPIFFMISGATLIDYRDKYSTQKYLEKRFVRVGIPFLFWSLFACGYRIFVSHWEWQGLRIFLSNSINTRYIDIYWFFIPLFAVYLSIPLLSAVAKEYRIKLFTYISVCCFILLSVLPTLFLLIGLDYNYAMQLPVAGGYILYVLLGYLIANIDFSKSFRIFAYILAALGWIIHFAGTILSSVGQEAISGTFKGYLNFPAVMQAFGVMIAFKYFPWRKIIRGGFLELQKYTFGIYLVHIYFVEQIPRLFGVNTASIIWRTIGAVTIFCLSALTSWGLSKIRFIQKVIGC